MHAAGSARLRRRKPLLLALAAAIPLLVLRLLPPDRYAIYPPCPFRLYTGLLCPGCGATHALGALVRFDLRAAWHANPLLLVLAAFALLCVVTPLRRLPRQATLITVYVAVALFTIGRNL